MSKAREKKEQTVKGLQEIFSKCNVAIFTDYRGLSALNMTDLRRRLREAGIEYKVVKNTLSRFAAAGMGREELVSSFDGPVAIAFGYSDITTPARVLAEYIRESKTSLDIKGGFLSDRLLTLAEVTELATLPSREELIAKVLGGMQSPLTALVNCLNAPMRGVIRALQARMQQLEEG